MSTECKFCECIKATPQKRRRFKECPNPLENWEKWLRDRRETQEILKRKTGRSQGELLMNLGEELRKIQEEKLILTYSQINTNFDRFRGNPEFWKLPVGLANECPNVRDPIYFTIKSKEEKNEIPQVEYIGIPNKILDEKNVLPRTRNIYNKWKNSAYRNSCIQKISSKISLIQPHRPDISELMVTGNKLSIDDQEHPDDVTKTSISEYNQYSKKISFEVHRIPKISFSINEVAFSNDENLTSGMKTIRLLFEMKELQNTPVTKQVTFENWGIRTLRFYWHKFEKFRTFRDIVPNRPQATAFYFDKTEILLVPGRKFQLPIWFMPEQEGHYTECWEITTSPKFWNEDFKFIVRLQGFVTDGNFEARCGAIKDMLDTKVRNTLIKDILNESMGGLRYAETGPVVYHFSEKELFESANQEVIGVAKKPKYLYDQDLVGELKEIYKIVRNTNDCGEEWDYSIEKLKVLAREKDVVEYVEKLTADCARSKNRLRELCSPIEQSEAGQKIEEAVVENDEPNMKRNNLKRLQILLQKLERPAMIPNTEREKFLHAYFVMGTYFSKMCAALDALDGGNGEILKNYQPFYDFRSISSIEDLPSRLVIEKFDDIWVERTKRAPPEPQTGFTMTPKPRILENIPLEDTTTVFNTYFKKTPQKSENKGTKSVQKPAPILEKSKSKQLSIMKMSQTQTVPEGPIRENFDPFADIENVSLYPTILNESIASSLLTGPKIEDNHSKEQKTEYDYQKYLIVYTSLCSAVDAMVATLETLKELVVPVETFAEVSRTPAKIRTEPQNINSCSSEEDPYFRYLLDTHLTNNPATKEYFIHGRTAPSVEELSVREEPSVHEELPNLFKSHETLVVEPIESRSTLLSQGVQTSYTGMDSVTSETVLKVESLEGIQCGGPTNIEESEKTSDIFYFMDKERAEE
ncbi:unnamed protein product [Phaedon cochleariae]|uniref:MYCBP-associated protein n=1 Tax=Phaedon cochleariae TaxID=80249 RepID=A0A9N9X0L6_PHACE|nr:unnamed protein product [Phaedon cochleariae]